ncbi:MAG: hypothetical protein QHJ73_11255, partial [Armatimonadota bacterium]|nr:hypothetical protein [Armatimonadota bacterium]
AAICFADNAGDSSTGFSGTLELDDCRQSRHDILKNVWDLFEALPYYRTRPRPDLVDRGYCLADPGRDYLVYLESPSPVRVAVEGGPYRVEWIDARRTDRRHFAELPVGQSVLTPPPGGDDWLLYLSRLPVAPPRPSRHRFTVRQGKTWLDGREFRAVGLRVSNALLSDAATDELLAHLSLFAAYGVNTISVYLQGSRFGDVRGYRPDATLDPLYAARLARIIEAADDRAMVVLVGCLYWGETRAKFEHWTQTEANAAVANTVRWLKERGYRNVFVDVDNEGMAQAEKGFDNRQLVLAGKAADPECVIATNFRGLPPPEADLGIHHSAKDPAKPYIESEGSAANVSGGYWGPYSKRERYYNYINIGVHTSEMQARQKADTAAHLERGWGYLLASTWLQCAPPHGPNHRPGGTGTPEDPGIRWWLEWVREQYGPYRP